MFNAYASSGETPKFPVCGSDGGFNQIGNHLSQGGYIGQTFLILPDGSFEGGYKGGSDYGVGYYLGMAPPFNPSSYELTVNKGSGSGTYDAAEVITVTANSPPAGYEFSQWSGDTQYLSSKTSATAQVTMPAKDIEITATYTEIPVEKFSLTVTDGSGSGTYEENETVSVRANSAPSGFQFSQWTGDTQYLNSSTNISAIVTMPAKNIEITATYKEIPAETFVLTVNEGAGSGNYAKDEVVTVRANSPASGFEFSKWIGDTQYLQSSTSKTTTVTMPGKDISITASYTEIGIDTINPSSNLLTWCNWSVDVDTLGSLVDTGSSLISDDKVEATFTTTESDSVNDLWAWGTVISAFPEGNKSNLNGVKYIKLTYRSTGAFDCALPQSGVDEDGASYRFSLPETGSEFKTILLKTSEFAKPEYASQEGSLDLAKVKELSFVTISDYEGSNHHLEISSVIIYDYPGDEVGISTPTGMKLRKEFVISSVGQQLSLLSPMNTKLNLTIYAPSGRKLHSVEDLSVETGNNSITLPSNMATGYYLISMKGVGININRGVVIK